MTCPHPTSHFCCVGCRLSAQAFAGQLLRGKRGDLFLEALDYLDWLADGEDLSEGQRHALARVLDASLEEEGAVSVPVQCGTFQIRTNPKGKCGLLGMFFGGPSIRWVTLRSIAVQWCFKDSFN